MATKAWYLASIADLEAFVAKADLYNNVETFENLINSVSAFMERYTARKLLARNYNHETAGDKEDAIGDGDGSAVFFTSQWPINSITELKIGDDVISAASDWDEDGYFFYNSEGKIYYENGFDAYRENVRLKYNAGYATTSSEYETLNFICCLLIKYVWDNRNKLGFKQEFLGRYRYTRANFKDADPWLWEMLDSFKRQRISL